MLTIPILTLFRALLLMLSFTGLCAAVRSAPQPINRYIAPLLTACTIIIVLMLSGMLGVLKYGFYLLYFGGFAGLIHTYLIRKVKPDYCLIGLLVLFSAYLVWRCCDCPLSHSDDFSHWALVSDYILDHDAFPDAAATLIRFQSYPLGAASFIYYITRTFGNHEGIYTIAQHLLEAFALLPMLALIENNRKYLYPVFAIGYVFLITRNSLFINLQVDWLLAYFAIRGITSIVHYRRNLKRALLIALPTMIVLVYLKSSGVFSSVCILLAILIIEKKSKTSPRKLAALLFYGAISIIGAYLLWNIHTSIAFPAAENSKHAVSLSAYAGNIAEKGPSVIAQIGRMMIDYLLHPDARIILAFLLFGGIAFALIAGCLILPGQRIHLKTVLCGLLCSIGTFAAWYIMLFFMYVFSMPTVEAVNLASITRYTSTGLTLLSGLGLILLLAFFGRKNLTLPRWIRAAYALAACILTVALILRFPSSNLSAKLFNRETEPLAQRAQLQKAKGELSLPADSRILICVDNPDLNNTIDTVRGITQLRHMAAYEFESADINILFKINASDFDSVGPQIFANAPTDADYCCQTTDSPTAFSNDPAELLGNVIGGMDAVIILHPNDALINDSDIFFRTNQTDIPIYFSEGN